MKKIVDSLGSEQWSFIDLTLKEFDLPTQETWSGATDSYIMKMLEGAKDHNLSQLAQHFGFALNGSQKAILEPTFWVKDSLKVFLSHLSSHKIWARELQIALAELGISAFVAHEDIKPTTEWQSEIELALATCDSLVALLHKDFHASNWTNQEIGFAMGRGVPVFAVRLGEAPYGFIGKFQGFNGYKQTPLQVAKSLFAAYLVNKATQTKVSESLLERFRNSSSFAEAKELVGQLEELQTWGADFSKRIEAAGEANSQIVGSWGVPDRVKALVKKWK